MIAPLVHGFLASLIISVAMAMSAVVSSSRHAIWESVFIIVALVVATAFVQRFQERRNSSVTAGPDLERYDGVSDLLIHLHTPAAPDRPARWTLRGLLSWILSGMGFGYGPEGIAMEITQASRMSSRSSATRWSDLRRRTDAALALAAGISAGFGAPFAAVLLPAELSIGGHVLSSVLASVSAYVGVQYLRDFFATFGIHVLGFQERLSSLWGFRFNELGEWVSAVIVCSACSLAAILVLSALRQVRGLFERVSRGRAWLATTGAGVLLLSVLLLAPQSMGSLPAFFESVVRNELPIPALVSLGIALFLTLAAIYSGMGTAGVWWPSLLMGAVVSMLILRGLLATGLVHPGTIANSVLLGAVSWTVVWFRTPISVAVLAYELSGRGSLLLPALFVGWGARLLAKKLGSDSWIEGVLEFKDFRIREGRSMEVLKSLTAGDAMVRDFQSVRATDSIEDCHRVILECRYPFLAVVNESGTFMGLLTVDVVEEGLQAQKILDSEEKTDSNSRLESLLEAKDLLYRTQLRSTIETALVSTQLSELTGVFENQICLPVLSADGRPLGLIFPSDVRHAYDRELARLSFIVQARSI